MDTKTIPCTQPEVDTALAVLCRAAATGVRVDVADGQKLVGNLRGLMALTLLGQAQSLVTCPTALRVAVDYEYDDQGDYFRCLTIYLVTEENEDIPLNDVRAFDPDELGCLARVFGITLPASVTDAVKDDVGARAESLCALLREVDDLRPFVDDQELNLSPSDVTEPA